MEINVPDVLKVAEETFNGATLDTIQETLLSIDIIMKYLYAGFLFFASCASVLLVIFILWRFLKIAI